MNKVVTPHLRGTSCRQPQVLLCGGRGRHQERQLLRQYHCSACVPRSGRPHLRHRPRLPYHESRPLAVPSVPASNDGAREAVETLYSIGMNHTTGLPRTGCKSPQAKGSKLSPLASLNPGADVRGMGHVTRFTANAGLRVATTASAPEIVHRSRHPAPDRADHHSTPPRETALRLALMHASSVRAPPMWLSSTSRLTRAKSTPGLFVAIPGTVVDGHISSTSHCVGAACVICGACPRKPLSM